MREREAEDFVSVCDVLARVCLVGVPDQIEIVAWHQKTIWEIALQFQKLFVTIHGLLEKGTFAVVRQRHLRKIKKRTEISPDCNEQLIPSLMRSRTSEREPTTQTW